MDDASATTALLRPPAPFIALPSAGHIVSLEEPDPLSIPLMHWLDSALALDVATREAFQNTRAVR